MKRIVALLLALLLLLTACGTEDGENPEKKEDNQTVTTTTPQKETEGKEAEKEEKFNSSGLIEETVLYAENDVRITALSLEYSNYSAELELLIENNSTEELTISGYGANSINGYMVGGYLNSKVTAGKKANETITFSYDELLLYGISAIADMELAFEITDNNFDSIYSGPVVLKTSLADVYEYSETSYQDAITNPLLQATYGYSISYFDREAVYENNGIRIASYGLMTNRSDETMLLMEVVNSTEEPIRLNTDNISVNDLIVYGGYLWSNDLISAGKRRIIGIELSYLLKDSYWDIYGIDEIENMGVGIRVRGFDGEILDETAVVFGFSGQSGSFDSSGIIIHDSEAIKLVFKDIVDNVDDYDDSIYILMMVENKSGQQFVVDYEYDTFSINGYMCDCSFPALYMDAGSTAILEIKLYQYMLEDTGISQADEIQTVELTMEIRDEKYKTIEMVNVAFASELQTRTEEANSSEKLIDGMRPEFKEAMDAYEAFYTEYCEFMKEYSENPTDLTLLAKYADMLVKAEEMNEAFEEWDESELSNEELKYYLDVYNRVMKMLVDVTG